MMTTLFRFQSKYIIAILSTAVFSTPIAAAISTSDLDVPADAYAPSKLEQGFVLPSEGLISGPLTDAVISRTLMQVEANPPVRTRGAGGPALERLFAARCRSVVFIAQRYGKKKSDVATGTGSIVSIDGHILTAAHVVAGSQRIAIGIFPSCKPGAQPEYYPAKIVRIDSSVDLALLQLVKLPSDIATMPLGRLNEVRTGSAVVMIGHPQNLFMSLSQGTVSAIRPNFKFLKSRATVIQTDGALNPGNSGGPMLSSKGNLIGVNSFIRGKASAGLNFAVAITEVNAFLSNKNVAKPKIEKIQKPKQIAKIKKCEPKLLKEWRKNKAIYKMFDFSCKGQGNAVYIKYDDREKGGSFSIDRNRDGKIDLIYLLNKKSNPYTSLWDDDYDGTYDFRGKHTSGNLQPERKVRI